MTPGAAARWGAWVARAFVAGKRPGLSSSVVEKIERAAQVLDQFDGGMSGGGQSEAETQGSVSTVVPMTTAEAATRLGVSARTVRRRAERGELTGVKIGPNWVVALPDDREE